MNSEQLRIYLQKSKDFGFLSPKEIEEQIEHAQDLYSMLPVKEGKLLDMGAGGGLPSLVFMTQDNDFEYTLLDAMKKRTDFLEETSNELGEGKSVAFDVINGRAEEVAKRSEYIENFDIVVARGFGPPATTAECACNFIKQGGYLFVSGSPDDESDRWQSTGLDQLGFKLLEIKDGIYATGVILEKYKSHDVKFPRRDGVPRKKPIW